MEDVHVDSAAASASANKVLERHAAQRLDANSDVMPNVHPIPSRNSRVQAMQRLATQRGSISFLLLLHHYLLCSQRHWEIYGFNLGSDIIFCAR